MNHRRITLALFAQALYKVIPEAVSKPEDESKDLWAVDYTRIIPVLVKSVQQQQKIIEDQNKVIAEMQKDLAQCCMSYNDNSNSAKHGSTEAEVAKLEQNNPNPFSESTIIKFYVPANAGSAFVKIYSFDGAELKSFASNRKGINEFTVAPNSLAAGVYAYTLIVDGKAIDTKQMIVTK